MCVSVCAKIGDKLDISAEPEIYNDIEEENRLLVRVHKNDFDDIDVEGNNEFVSSALSEKNDADIDAETFAHLFHHLSHEDATRNSYSSLQPVWILLRIPLYRSLLCGKAVMHFTT